LRKIERGEVVLEPDVARYVCRVHRLGAGAEIVVFDPDARVEADARLLSVGRAVRCDVGEVRSARAVARTGVTLVQALGKGEKPERVVRDATTLGVARIVFCTSRRTVVRPDGDGWSRADRLYKVAVDAARQSGRGDVPAIEGPSPFEDVLATEGPRHRFRICLAPHAATTLGAALREWTLGEPIAVLIGPEGGFDRTEIDRAAAAGFLVVRFGDFVLRTETTTAAVLGALLGRE
jgi:16S rRNA (uracil1498-N3)-methyltransferase